MGETFVLPKDDVQKDTMLIPGTDGEKMSKSRENTINVFLPEKKLRKQIMSIATDSKGLDDVKDPLTCNVFALYQMLADKQAVNQMTVNYSENGYGYGHAKQELFELILSKFFKERKRYSFLMENPDQIEKALTLGADKARKVAKEVLKRTREKLGY
tara:strand:- start:36 stop:506 length:471 start_codon:yes stop_codon:yes gene_type:complete